SRKLISPNPIRNDLQNASYTAKRPALNSTFRLSVENSSYIFNYLFVNTRAGKRLFLSTAFSIRSSSIISIPIPLITENIPSHFYKNNDNLYFTSIIHDL